MVSLTLGVKVCKKVRYNRKAVKQEIFHSIFEFDIQVVVELECDHVT